MNPDDTTTNDHTEYKPTYDDNPENLNNNDVAIIKCVKEIDVNDSTNINGYLLIQPQPNHINAIIKCQAHYRRRKSNESNIFYQFKNNDALKKKFKETILGYSLINKAPIKESVWEEINTSIVEDLYHVSDSANGNHTSGKDNKYKDWNISQKTIKISSNNQINLSSYRLTSVCSDRNYGEKKSIKKEIEKRDSSFDFYSILLRKERDNTFEYIWLIVPKDYYIFKINDSLMEYKIGKIGKKKNKTVGWQSLNFDITFSMSSQLWYHFRYEDIKKYIINTITIDNSKPKLRYDTIYNLTSSI